MCDGIDWTFKKTLKLNWVVLLERRNKVEVGGPGDFNLLACVLGGGGGGLSGYRLNLCPMSQYEITVFGSSTPVTAKGSVSSGYQ